MTPDDIRCWICGGPTKTLDEAPLQYCIDPKCWGHVPQDVGLCLIIDDRLAAVREEATNAERERCAVACETMEKDIVCPEECAARIRKGEGTMVKRYVFDYFEGTFETRDCGEWVKYSDYADLLRRVKKTRATCWPAGAYGGGPVSIPLDVFDRILPEGKEGE